MTRRFDGRPSHIGLGRGGGRRKGRVAVSDGVAREGRNTMGRELTMTQERWLTRSRGARFWLSLWPTLGGIALVVLAAVVVWSSDLDLLAFVVVLVVLMCAVPGALVAAVLAAWALAAGDSTHGRGVVALAAVGGAVLGVFLALLPTWS